MKKLRIGTVGMVLTILLVGTARGTVLADGIPFPTIESSQFLLIGLGPENDLGTQPGIGQAVNVNNFELGANKAPVPSTSDFLNSGGGPGLLGNVPDIPLNAKPLYTGICGNGNIAITSADGVFNLQDVGVYADLGILTAQSASNADAGTQNSFMNDPEQFPNTFVSSGFTNPGVNNNIGGTGLFVNPGDADQSTRIDAGNFAGVTGGVDFTDLLNELTTARTVIPGLAQTDTLDTSGNGGKISTDTTIDLPGGLSVIDIVTGGSDFLLENSNLVIDGPQDASAIFRVPDDANFLISNGNILIGSSGIELGSVLFFSDREDNAQHFNFDNTILNGVAFWTLEMTGGEIVINNAQGCTQLIADKINLNDVRFCKCGFHVPPPGGGDPPPIPEPAGLGLLGVVLLAARKRRS